MSDLPVVMILGEPYKHKDGRTLIACLDPDTRAIVAFHGTAQRAFRDAGEDLAIQYEYTVPVADWQQAFLLEPEARGKVGDAIVTAARAQREAERHRIVPGVAMPPGGYAPGGNGGGRFS